MAPKKEEKQPSNFVEHHRDLRGEDSWHHLVPNSSSDGRGSSLKRVVDVDLKITTQKTDKTWWWIRYFLVHESKWKTGQTVGEDHEWATFKGIGRWSRFPHDEHWERVQEELELPIDDRSQIVNQEQEYWLVWFLKRWRERCRANHNDGWLKR